MKELQQGIIYKTKIGAKATIKGVDEIAIYPFLASVEFIDASYNSPKIGHAPVSYNPYGLSNRSFRDFDIISEWNESDSLPKYEFNETPFVGSILEGELKRRYSNEAKEGLVKQIENLLKEKKSTFWQDALDFVNNDSAFNKWRSDKRFEGWLSSQGDSANALDRETLREIFDVMDKEERKLLKQKKDGRYHT